MKAVELPNPGLTNQQLRFELAAAISRAQVAAANGDSTEAERLQAMLEAAAAACETLIPVVEP